MAKNPKGSKEIEAEVPNQDYRYYPGKDGVKFRHPSGVPLPSIKQDDPEHKQPQFGMDAQVRVFDLADKEDLAAYQKMWDDICKGHCRLASEDKHWCEETQNFKVLARWGNVYLEMYNGSRESYELEQQVTFS
jgi:hypothetical protein